MPFVELPTRIPPDVSVDNLIVFAAIETAISLFAVMLRVLLFEIKAPEFR